MYKRTGAIVECLPKPFKELIPTFQKTCAKEEIYVKKTHALNQALAMTTQTFRMVSTNFANLMSQSAV